MNPQVAILQGTPLSGTLFDPNRTLYLYFRSTDLSSTTPWQPGTTQNWVNALFYNPSGVGGAPYIQSSFGQTDLEYAGVTRRD